MQCHLRNLHGVLLKPRCTNDIRGSFHEFHFCMAHGVTFSTRGAWQSHSSIGERQTTWAFRLQMDIAPIVYKPSLHELG